MKGFIQLLKTLTFDGHAFIKKTISDFNFQFKRVVENEMIVSAVQIKTQVALTQVLILFFESLFQGVIK